MTEPFFPTELESLFQVFKLLERGKSVRLSASPDEPAVDDAPPGSGGPFLGLYSSGSTGTPRLFWRSWNEMKSELRATAETRGWIWASPFSPLSYAGVQVAAQAWKTERSIISLSPDWDLNRELFAGRKANALSCTPTFLDMMLQAGFGGPAFQINQITLGGEILRPAAGERFRTAFPETRFSVVYASTEHGVLLKTHRLDGWYESASLVGRYPGFRAHDGELQILKGGSWQGTGDLVEMKGELMRVAGRMGSIANVAGSKVNLDEVTLLAEEVAGVRGAIAYAEPNPVAGQIVCLRFVPEAGCSEIDVQQRLEKHLREKLRKEAWPRRWEMGPPNLGPNAKRAVK